jgi:hypothetical protein
MVIPTSTTNNLIANIASDSHTKIAQILRQIYTKEKTLSKSEEYNATYRTLSYILTNAWENGRVLGQIIEDYQKDNLGEFGNNKQSKNIDKQVERKKRKTIRQKQLQTRQDIKQRDKEIRLENIKESMPTGGKGSRINQNLTDVLVRTKAKKTLEKRTDDVYSVDAYKILGVYQRQLKQRHNYLAKSLLLQIDNYIKLDNQKNLENIYKKNKYNFLDKRSNFIVSRLIETEITSAFSLGRIEFFYKQGWRYFVWNNRSLKGEEDCLLCQTADKMVFDILGTITQNMGKFQSFNGKNTLIENIKQHPDFPKSIVPPIHPFCSCFISPLKDYSEYAIALANAKDTVGWESVPQFSFYLTNEAQLWFKANNKERQSQLKKLLGNEIIENTENNDTSDISLGILTNLALASEVFNTDKT